MIRHGVSAGGNFHALMGQNRQLIHSHTSAMTIPRLQLRLCVFVGVRRYFPAGNPSFSISRDGCFISALVAAAVDQGSVRQLRTVAGIHSSGSSPGGEDDDSRLAQRHNMSNASPGFWREGLPQQILIITPSVLPHPDVTGRAPPGNCQCDEPCSLLLHSDRVSVTSKLPEFYSWQVMSACFAV